MMNMKPKNAAIYCRATAQRGLFEPEDADTLTYQTGSAMAFIMDHDLTFVGLYTDEELPNLHSMGEETSGIWLLSRDSAAGLIDVIIVRDMNVIAPDDEAIQALEQSSLPLVIGAEDLYYTKEDFDLERFRFVDSRPSAISEGMQERIGAGKYVGRIPYGYKRHGEELIADPEAAKVVREIFLGAAHGYNPTDIKDLYLNERHIPTPGRARSWNRETVYKILTNKVYCGEAHIEAIIDKALYDQANETLNEIKDRKEPDPFPMARCDVCNSKLVYEKAGSIPRLYHTSYLCRTHRQKIRIEDFTQEVLRQCNEFLASVDMEPDDEERRQKTVELGEIVLAKEQAGEDYNGLWKNWYKNCFLGAVSHWGRQLIRYKYSEQFDIQDGKWIIRSIRLREDCTMKIGFWGDGGC